MYFPSLFIRQVLQRMKINRGEPKNYRRNSPGANIFHPTFASTFLCQSRKNTFENAKFDPKDVLIFYCENANMVTRSGLPSSYSSITL